METKYFVSTSMGPTLLDPSSKAYVQVTRDKFLTKEASDLNLGDMVLFEKPFASTKLEDVDPYLDRSPRYAAAKEMLHKKNRHGNYVPILRVLLIEGLANRGVIGNANLESRILFDNNTDFSKEEYDAMESYLYGALTKEDRTPAMTKPGLRNWLNGSVVAPRDWLLLQTLAESVNERLSIFQYGSQDQNGLYFNYRLYVTIRQGVMKFLKQARGEPPDEEWKQAENLITLSPEYQIVFEHFLKDLTMNYAAARVNQITRITKTRQIKLLKERYPNLQAGIVTSSADVKLKRKSFPELIEDSKVLVGYMRAAVAEFRYDNPVSHGLTGWQRHMFSFGIGPQLMMFFGEDFDPMLKLELEIFKTHSFPQEELKSYANGIKEAMFSGELDRFYGLTHGMTMRLLESVYRVRTAVPNRIFAYQASVREGKVIARKDPTYIPRMQREWLAQEKDLAERYGLKYRFGDKTEGGFFFSQGFMKESQELGMSPLEFIDSIVGDALKFKQLVREVRSRMNMQTFLITKERAANILNQFGLEEIVGLRKQDFYFEQLVA